MGTEIRRVPPDWKHPTYRDILKQQEYHGFNDTHLEQRAKDRLDEYHPQYYQVYYVAAQLWIYECVRWENGDHPERRRFEKDMNRRCFYWEWMDLPPDPCYYRHRVWKPEDATAWQVYETVTEGTPESPVFLTIEEVAQWYITNRPHWNFTLEDAIEFVQHNSVPKDADFWIWGTVPSQKQLDKMKISFE